MKILEVEGETGGCDVVSFYPGKEIGASDHEFYNY